MIKRTFYRKFSDIFMTIGAIVLIAVIGHCQAWTLRGVSLRNPPYIDSYEENSTSGAVRLKYKGYIIDMIDEIKFILRFDYKFHFAADGRYGDADSGDRSAKLDGMFGELIDNKADFAVADIMMTDDRQRLSSIEFTEPYMIEEGIAALISADNADANLTTLEALVDSGRFQYGIVAGGNLGEYFRQTNEPLPLKMAIHLARHPNQSVATTLDGIARLFDNRTKYALIVESTFAKFTAGYYCNLSVINGVRAEPAFDYEDGEQFADAETSHYFPRKYAIAFRRGAKYLEWFNLALRRLHCAGNLHTIRKHYLNSTALCSAAAVIGLTISVFWLSVGVALVSYVV